MSLAHIGVYNTTLPSHGSRSKPGKNSKSDSCQAKNADNLSATDKLGFEICDQLREI